MVNSSTSLGAAADAPRAIQPATPPIDERRDRGRGGDRAPGAPAAHDPAERQAIGHRLVDHGAVARADGFGLRAPCGDAGGVVGMVGQPRLDGFAAIRRQLAVDIDVQLVFRHGCVVVDHGMTFLVI